MSENKPLSNAVQKSYDILDLLKLILSLFVVCIHTRLLPAVFHPWVRTAVPLFFLMSAYFFFHKLKSLKEEDRSGYLKKYVKRNLLLYLFYFVLLLPVTIIRQGYLHDSVLLILPHFLQDLVFGSTFYASWFIMASVEGTILLYFLAKRLPNWALILIGALLYAVGCAFSVYRPLLDNFHAVQSLMDSYQKIFLNPHNSVIVSIIWIAIGKTMAESEKTISRPKLIAFVLTSGILLEAEYLLLRPEDNQDDCFIMLIPFCISVFRLLLDCSSVTINHAAYLRKFSTMIYAMHGSVLFLLRYFLGALAPSLNQPVVLWLCTVLICTVYGFLILRLEKIERLRFLRYAH